MKKTIIILILFCLFHGIYAQDASQQQVIYENSAEKLLKTEGKLLIGGYGEVHYNQPFDKESRSNGMLDVHRMVLLFGYNFNSRTQFISEIEFEHVSEVYIEQAFLQHKVNQALNFRAGLLLIPMGIINEYHEPTTFHGVERPMLDNRIVPTTWREIGFGAYGNLIAPSLKYQLYVVNGFLGYDGEAYLNGKNGLRSGRQKGAESIISSPNLTSRIEYYGIRGLQAGISGYFGKTQSTLYHGTGKSDQAALDRADSSVVGIAMLGADARYTAGALQLKGQFYYTQLGNTEQFNRFTAKEGKQNDLGSAMHGYYLEAGYNLFHHFPAIKSELVPFFRLEQLDTHAATAGALERNEAYRYNVLTTGLTFKLAKGAVVKSDLQFVKPENADTFSKTVNLGVGVMF